MIAKAVHWCDSPADPGRPDDTCAWVVSLDDPAVASLACLPARDVDERDLGSRTGDAARRFLQRRAVLRHLVGRRCGIPPETVEVVYGEGGRPTVTVPSRSIFCSVSGRGSLAALALATTPVGIDIEPLVPGPIPWNVLAAREAAGLRALPEAARSAAFLMSWTLKEAYLKAIGIGFDRDPAGLAVVLEPAPAILDGRRRIALDPTAVRGFGIGGAAQAAACVAL